MCQITIHNFSTLAFQLNVVCTWIRYYIIATSDEPEPSWLELKDFQLGSAGDILYFSSKLKIGRKRAEIQFSVEDLFLITVFPRIVSAETIIFWKLECGKYSREETIDF